MPIGSVWIKLGGKIYKKSLKRDSMNTIKKIFEGGIDEEVHSEFVKFGRGIFKDRYLLEMKKQKDAWSVKTSAEFANFLVRTCLAQESGKVKMSGAIITTLKLEGKFPFEIERVKQFAGIKQYIVNSELEAPKLLEFMKEHPRLFYGLSFSNERTQLKIKAKAPKSGKPATKGEDAPKADFCSLKTKDAGLVRDLFFDLPESAKEAKINHTLEINDIVLPKGVSDPVELREKAERKGIVKRIVTISGEKKESQKEFSA